MFPSGRKPIVKFLCYLVALNVVGPATGLTHWGVEMWLIDTNTGIFLITVVSICGFFLGHAMDGVLENEGFGPYGNMVIILAGFVGGVLVMRYFGFSIKDFRVGVTGGLLGSFAMLVSMVLTKNVMHRLGY